MMKNKMIKAFISAVMVVVMLVSMVAPVFAGAVGAGQSYAYVAVGDAMTNGIGLDDPSVESYALKVVEWLDAEDDYALYARNGYRIEELRYLLDASYAGDGYTKQLGGMNIERLDGKFKEYVINAEKMSINIGTNNFSTYFIEQMMYYLQNKGAVKYAYSFDEFADTEVEQTMENMADVVMEYLLAASPDKLDPALELVEFMTEVAAYTVLSYVTSFNALMDAIYELNPDIDLYVVGVHNPASGNIVTYDVGDRTLELPLGEAVGALVEMANAYAQILAPRAYDYTYVHPGNPELLIDRMGDTTRGDEERIPGAVRLELLNAVEDTVTDMIKEMFAEYGITKTDKQAREIAEEIFACVTPEDRKEYIRSLMNDLAVEEVIKEFEEKLENYASTYGDIDITAAEIKNLLDSLEAATDLAGRKDVATDFVEDLMTQAMVGKEIDGVKIETQEDAYKALEALKKFHDGDPDAMKEAAADMIMPKIAENGLSGLIARNDVIDLLTQLDGTSTTVQRRAVIKNWMNGIAVRNIVPEVQAIIPSYTELQAQAMLEAMEAAPEANREAIAKQHLLADGFHAFMVDKFTETYTDNDLTVKTYPTIDAFVTAVEQAPTDEAAKVIVRNEIRAAAAQRVETESIGLMDQLTDDVVAGWFTTLDGMAAGADKQSKLNELFYAWVPVAYPSITVVPDVIADPIKASLWSAYSSYNNAATAAEDAFVQYRNSVDTAAETFAEYVSLKDAAAEQILSTYENYYQGAGANAQQYYNDYINLRDEAVDKVLEGYDTYMSVLDKGMDAADQMNGKFDDVFDLLREIAEVETISLNHLLSVAQKMNADYVAEMVDNLAQGQALTDEEKTVAYLALRYYLAGGKLVFPSEKGHETIANQIIRAMKGENTNSAAGDLANAIADKTVELYRLAKKYLTLPNTGSGQVDTIINPDLYVALGDDITGGTALDASAKTYPQLIGDALAMADDSFDDDVVANYAIGGMRTEELLALVDSSYTGDAYTEARYGAGYFNGLRAQYLDNIKNADLITLNVGINNLTTFPITQTLLAYNGEETYEMDWTRYIGDNYYNKINKGKNIMIDLVLGIVDRAENRVPELDGYSAYERCERAVNVFATAIESMLYGMVGYIVNLDTAVEKIGELNPNATIVMIGFYNPMEGTYINIDRQVTVRDKTIDLSKYTFNVSAVFDKVVNQGNRILTNFVGYYKDDGVAGHEGSRFVTVDIKNTELAISDSGVSKDLSTLETYRTLSVRGHEIDIKVPSYFMQAGRTAGEALHPNADGHAYIADRVLNALKFDIYADVVFGEYEKFEGDPDPDFTFLIDDLSSLYPLEAGQQFQITREPGETIGEYKVYATVLDKGGYAEIDIEVGKLTIKQRVYTGTVDNYNAGFSLRLKDEIYMNLEFPVLGFEGWDRTEMVNNVCLLVFDTKTPSSADSTIANADQILPVSEYDAVKDSFTFHTDPVAAKDMDISRWYKMCIQLTDGSYVYSGRFEYSPKIYCNQVVIKTPTKFSDELKSLCVALMNYGTAAQKYFADKNGFVYASPMNDIFADDVYQNMVDPYDASVLDDRIAIDKTQFNVGNPVNQSLFSSVKMSLSLEGAIEQNVRITATSNLSSAEVYYWDEETYANLIAAGEKLTKTNADGMAKPAVEGNSFVFKYDGLSAKQMGKTTILVVYVRGSFGLAYSEPLRISIDNTAKQVINGNYSDEFKTLAKEMVVYGEYAKEYFATRTEQE